MLGYAPALSDRLDLFVVGGEATRWVGVLLYAVGGALRIAPVFALGERFSGLVAIQPDHELVTDGLYRRIRNPSYLGLLISTLGWALAFRSSIGILLTALLVVPLVARMRPRRRCSANISARPTPPIAPAPGGSCRGSIEPNGIAQRRVSPHFALRSSSG